MELAGKVAVVTGAAGGIGAAVAQRFLEQGAKVVIGDLDADRLAAQRTRLSAFGDVEAQAGDAASAADIEATLALAERAFGRRPDVYVANAGVGIGEGLGDDRSWAIALEVNLMAHVRAAQAMVPVWLERGSGAFVSTASAAGLLTQHGSATYATSKHAAVGFSEWLAATYGADGIEVSCLCPMGVDTDLLKESGGASRAAQRAVTESGPVLEPLDVADCVVTGMRERTFLILPHANVLDLYRNKGADYDRWIRGMQKFGAYLASS